MAAEGIFEFLEVFKQGWYAMLWVFLVPLTIVLVGPAIRPAQAVHHFTFHRMQHYEYTGSVREKPLQPRFITIKHSTSWYRDFFPSGSPAVGLNCEVRNFFSSTVSRKCLVVSWKEFISADVDSLIQKGIVALIIALPSNLDVITGEDRTVFLESEQSLLRRDFQIPVYFVEETPEVTEWLKSMSYHTGNRNVPQTATEELIQQMTGDYYYLSSSVSSAKVISDAKATNFFGKLTSDPSEQLPVLLLVSHLDSFAVAPGLSFGANSDASGIAAVLEIVRILSELLRSQKSQPKMELAVLLSGGGKFNYLGTKKWLDEQAESLDSGLLSRIQYAACFDAVGQNFPPNIYVSRPPKENSPAFGLFEILNRTAKSSGTELPVVHKKINLADDELVWEHEQFSIAKVSAFTVSSFPMNKSPERKSLLDTRSQVDVKELAKTVRLFVKVLAGQIYGLKSNSSDITSDLFMDVSESHLQDWIALFTKQPRALQFLTAEHPAMTSVKDFLAKYLVDFKVKPVVNEKGDSDIMMYGPLDISVTASRTKQPFFDLLVTLVIGLYGCFIFLLLQHVDIVTLLRRLLQPMLAGSLVKIRPLKSTKYQ